MFLIASGSLEWVDVVLIVGKEAHYIVFSVFLDGLTIRAFLLDADRQELQLGNTRRDPNNTSSKRHGP